MKVYPVGSLLLLLPLLTLVPMGVHLQKYKHASKTCLFEEKHLSKSRGPKR